MTLSTTSKILSFMDLLVEFIMATTQQHMLAMEIIQVIVLFKVQ
jgi:hypothetical protein